MKSAKSVRGFMGISLGILWLQLGAHSLAWCDLRPEKVFLADDKKTKNYIKDGLITGGDQTTHDFTIKDIRHAKNSDYERLVIDIDTGHPAETTPIAHAPYYQVAITPDEKRLVVTLYGKPKLSFNAKKVAEAFKRSAKVQKINLLPLLDDESWTFSFDMKSGHPVEVFELSNPIRIILDIK